MTARSVKKPARPRDGDDAWRQLTRAERVVVELVEQGLSNKDVARELTVSVNTVKTHLRRIFRKVGVTNRTALAARSAARARHGSPEDGAR